MSETPQPTAISLHKKTRLLRVEFADGKVFDLPCEYLRVFSRAMEVRAGDTPVTGKESVNIEAIEPQGQYAVRLVFDDGHDTGIYSWDTLYQLGLNQERNWQSYLTRLAELGIQREESDASAKRRVKVLYFTYLVQKIGKDHEFMDLPPAVTSVETLTEFLRRRKPQHAWLFAEGSFRVTVNRQFCEPFTRIEDGDEIAYVPSSPYPPKNPNP